jgi:biotin carboxyl carrier protein
MSLTYEDVRTVLAVIDGHGGGTTRFTQGELSVVVQAGSDSAPATVSLQTGEAVRALAVGRFHHDAAETGSPLASDTVLGTIRAVGRETAVTAGMDGNFEGYAVADGEFVEYGQVVATVVVA